MPAVPVIIQRAEQEAQQEEGEKADAQELFPQADLFAAQEEYGQRHGGKAAVDVRQALHFCRLRRGEQVGQHAPRAVGEARQRLLLQQVQRALALCGLSTGVLCDVQRQQLRRLVPGGVGVLQAVERRQQQNGCHADAEQRAQRDAAEAAEKALPAVPAADAPDKEAQPDKDAAEKRKIVVAQQRECQRQRIQAEAALTQQADHAGQHQRQESQLRQNEQREEFPQQRRRDQHGQQVQGTGEVVGIQRQVADAHACLAQVLQRAAGAELFPERDEEGVILMPHVVRQHLPVTERPQAAKYEAQQHHAEWHEERQDEIAALPPRAVNFLHGRASFAPCGGEVGE